MKKFIYVALFITILFSCSGDEEITAVKEVKGATKQVAQNNIPLHPGYDVTMDDLGRFLSGMPADIREAILSAPKSFLDHVTLVLDMPQEIFFLVDKEHALPSDYVPPDLVNLRDYDFILNREGLQLRKVCIPDLQAMHRDASAEGLQLVLSSTYRSYDYQKDVFHYHVNTIGEAQAKRESAEPGKSQHQLGTTIDFGSITPAFGNTDEGKWLFEHAHEYGFSLSYPENMEELTGYIHEIWHYRWISTAGTALERKYFNGIQQYMLLFLHEHRTDLQNSRRSR